MTRVFTTGQVARIFSVNINTVIKWFDEGKLEGFRLPRSNERRIYRESVEQFMREHDIAGELLQAFDQAEAERRVRRGRPSTTPPPLPSRADLRTFPRKPVELTARLFIDETPTDVTVRNLSMGGVYITGYSHPDKVVPAEFKLRMEVSEGDRTLDGVCQLVHLRRQNDETLSLGCRFTQVDPGSLQSYLATV